MVKRGGAEAVPGPPYPVPCKEGTTGIKNNRGSFFFVFAQRGSGLGQAMEKKRERKCVCECVCGYCAHTHVRAVCIKYKVYTVCLVSGLWKEGGGLLLQHAPSVTV